MSIETADSQTNTCEDGSISDAVAELPLAQQSTSREIGDRALSLNNRDEEDEEDPHIIRGRD
jgi:hypothetical protein